MSVGMLKPLMIAVFTFCFVSSTYAAWDWNRNTTKCWNNNCRHVVVKKQCNNGKCWTYKHYNNWHR